MKKLLLSVAAMAALTFASTTANAQVMVTEFVKLSDDVELDVKSKSVEYTMNNNKGLKDLEWSTETHILAVTFDPRKTSLDDVLRKLADATNNEAVATKAVRTNSKLNNTVASKMNP